MPPAALAAAARHDRGVDEPGAETIHLGEADDFDPIADVGTQLGLEEPHRDSRFLATEKDLASFERREDDTGEARAMPHRPADGEGENLSRRNRGNLGDGTRRSDHGEVVPVMATQVGFDELAAVIHLSGREPRHPEAGIDEVFSAVGDGLDLHRDDPGSEVETQQGGVLIVRCDRPDNPLDADALVMVAAREEVVERGGNRLGESGMTEDFEGRLVDPGR